MINPLINRCSHKKNVNSLLVNLAIVLMLLSSCSQKETVATGDETEQKIEALLLKMSLQEKIGQTAQRSTSYDDNRLSQATKNMVRTGNVGSFLNLTNRKEMAVLQKIAVEESPNGIPLIFARDVIHGYNTIFPIPLGQAATWNPEIVEKGARIAAIEASNDGIRWTFAPMLDISRDARWGRIAESAGEDPFLTEIMGEAYVKGFQSDDLSASNTMAACVKHFVGYGAAEGGRDYNTSIIHDELLHNVYLRPFKAAIDAGAVTAMSSFNELNGIPASANKYALKDVLRDQWGFDGVVVSDWNSITEMINHGYSPNEKEAGNSAANAGVDMEMTSHAYEHHLEDLIKEGKFSEKQLDEMVKNILRVKIKLGLFDNPYFTHNDTVSYAKAHLAAAQQAAEESFVLLKNNNSILPLATKNQKIAVIGPMANQGQEQLGTWVFDGNGDRSVTPLTAFKDSFDQQNIKFAAGLDYSRDVSTDGFSSAISQAQSSDVIVFFAGEEAILSGEAHSRADINLPGKQEELIKKLSAIGKPIVLVIMAGRPITLGNILEDVDAVIHAWHPGTMAGPAIVNLITGKASPLGRLPVSYPKSVGQIPFYYNHKNTGRPAVPEQFVGINDIPIGAFQTSLGNTSHYLDDGYAPLYPFGYGLTYTSFEYSDIEISQSEIKNGDSLNVKFMLKNTGSNNGTETVQLYMQDEYASITRPVRELIDFQKVNLKVGEEKEVTFSVNTDQLKFYNAEKEWATEAGSFNLWVAPNAVEGLKVSFELEN